MTDVYIDEDKIAESYVEMKKYDGSVYDILEVTKGNVKLVFELLLPVIKALYTLSTGNPPLYHRDIKPDNILFLKKDDEYTLYLTDFGTCFLNDGSERLTPETMAVGPRMYIAPEYETGRVEEVTEKGDIFSLGKVLWCMINGEPEDFMPSNFWFVDEYDLIKRFPGNADMIVANSIIASCLNIAPYERCTYSSLIGQIENFIAGGNMTPEEEAQYRVRVYQEKRNLELLEIKEKNRLIVNSFSQYYIKALEELLNTYPDFELIQKLYDEYRKNSKDGIDYTSVNVENNASHYLYSGTYDRIYFSINYEPARGTDRYCSITIKYTIDSWKTMDNSFLHSKRLLLVDDEQELLKMVSDILKDAGFETVLTAMSVKKAILTAKEETPDLIVLDVMLPDGDGFSLMQQLRTFTNVPVIFLTAKDETADKLSGLGLGADDYISKPFMPQELLLRIYAVLRRTYKEDSPLLVLDGCTIDFSRAEVHKGSEIISLTAKEHTLLETLARNAGKIVTVDALCEALWGDNPFGYENSLNAHVRRVREKIETDPSKPVSLITIKGLGYKLIARK